MTIALKKPIPPQIVNESASFGPFDLRQFIESADQKKIKFIAELKNGDALPKGVIMIVKIRSR